MNLEGCGVTEDTVEAFVWMKFSKTWRTFVMIVCPGIDLDWEPPQYYPEMSSLTCCVSVWNVKVVCLTALRWLFGTGNQILSVLINQNRL